MAQALGKAEDRRLRSVALLAGESFLLRSDQPILLAFMADHLFLPFGPSLEILALLKNLVSEFLLCRAPAGAVMRGFEVAGTGLLGQLEEVSKHIAAFGGRLLDLFALRGGY
jgi:hypothetical protein